MEEKNEIKAVHKDLINSLIQGHVGYHPNTKTFDSWKGGFAKYCKEPVYKDRTVKENFDYLEENGMISPGKYAVLKDIFTGDLEAKEKIDDAVNKIEDISRRGSSDSENRHAEGL